MWPKTKVKHCTTMSIFCNNILLFIASIIATNKTLMQFDDKYCVINSIISSKIDGIYEPASFDLNTNISIWYNAEKDKYLFTFPQKKKNQFLIGPDPTVYIAYSHCESYTAYPCAKGWKSTNQRNWSDDTNMRIVNCNKRCITSNNVLNINIGTYIWSHFNYTTHSSVFYCSSNDMYLYDDLNNGFTLYNKFYTNTNLNNDLTIQKCTDSCHGAIQTHYYGINTINNSEFNAINQGKINEILSWTVYNDSSASIYKAIGNLNFKINQISFINSYFVSCKPFILDNNDYINGYRVIYKQHVYALFFYTANNKQYNCTANDLIYSDYHDTGIIIDNNYYLSGFKIRYKTVIDAISFQFTAVNNCVQMPTQSPTMNPTNAPTNIPTSYPTMTSMHPTNKPTISPTLYPSMQRDTHKPTLRAIRIAYPTLMPTFTTDIVKENVSNFVSTKNKPNIVSDDKILLQRYIIIISGSVMITLLTIWIIIKKYRRTNDNQNDNIKIETEGGLTTIEMLDQIWNAYPLSNEYNHEGCYSSDSDIYDGPQRLLLPHSGGI
eukprot:43941_1